ncbi:MAG TPA: hypothetical protein VLB29_13390 [Nocardioidaceae bacterium]|nr:hypothetical protein [Nocardioidaceae bacterium]
MPGWSVDRGSATIEKEHGGFRTSARCCPVSAPQVVVWELLDTHARKVFRRGVGVDEAEWLRGRAWALALAVMTFPYYWHTKPGRCAHRLAMARSVLADAATTTSANR